MTDAELPETDYEEVWDRMEQYERERDAQASAQPSAPMQPPPLLGPTRSTAVGADLGGTSPWGTSPWSASVLETVLQPPRSRPEGAVEEGSRVVPASAGVGVCDGDFTANDNWTQVGEASGAGSAGGAGGSVEVPSAGHSGGGAGGEHVA